MLNCVLNGRLNPQSQDKLIRGNAEELIHAPIAVPNLSHLKELLQYSNTPWRFVLTVPFPVRNCASYSSDIVQSKCRKRNLQRFCQYQLDFVSKFPKDCLGFILVTYTT
jgi:hypothetical protein